MPDISELGKLVKQKYPGAYDQMDDAALGMAVRAKYPGAYQDFELPAAVTGGVPVPPAPKLAPPAGLAKDEPLPQPEILPPGASGMMTPTTFPGTQEQFREKLKQRALGTWTHDMPPAKTTTEKVERGLLDAVATATSPATVGTMAGLGAATAIPAALAKTAGTQLAVRGAATALGAYFATHMAEQGTESYVRAYKAYQNGDIESAVRELGQGSVDLGLGLIGLRGIRRNLGAMETRESYERRHPVEATSPTEAKTPVVETQRLEGGKPVAAEPTRAVVPVAPAAPVPTTPVVGRGVKLTPEQLAVARRLVGESTPMAAPPAPSTPISPVGGPAISAPIQSVPPATSLPATSQTEPITGPSTTGIPLELQIHRVTPEEQQVVDKEVASKLAGMTPREVNESGLDAAINRKNVVYHATDLAGFKGILEKGEITSSDLVPDKEYTNFAEHVENGKLDKWKNEHLGVSVSRVPRVASKAYKAISFVIDAEKMPRSRPYTESGYGKVTDELESNPVADAAYTKFSEVLASKGKDAIETKLAWKAWQDELHFTGHSRNPQYEFENRTYNEPIPLSAVRGVAVDTSALDDLYGHRSSKWNYAIQEVKQLAASKGLPVTVYDSGREFHASRAQQGQFRLYSPTKPEELAAISREVGSHLGGVPLSEDEARRVFQDQYQREYHKWLDGIWRRPLAEVFPEVGGNYPPGTSVLTAYPSLPDEWRSLLTPDAWLQAKGVDLSVPVDLPPQEVWEATQVESELDKLFAGIPPDGPGGDGPGSLTPEERREVARDIVHFGWFRENFLTMLQIGYENPNHKPFSDYLEAWRGRTRSKSEVGLRGDGRIHEILGLGKVRQSKLFELALRLSDLSAKLKRRVDLNEPAAVELLKDLGIDEETLQIYRDMDSDFRWVLDRIENGLVDTAKAHSKTQAELNEKLQKLGIQFDQLRNQNYFPHSRFGRYTLTVIANQDGVVYDGKKFKKGQKVTVEFVERRGVQKSRATELEKEFGSRASIKLDKLDDTEFSFQGFPPALIEAMKGDLELTPEQITRLDQMLYELAPGQSFIKHLQRRRNIRGFSQDGLRAYASYIRSAASHISNLEWRDQLQRAILEANQFASAVKSEPGRQDVVPARMLAQYMGKNYKHMMNPGSELAALRGLAFKYWFVMVPKHVAINLTQVPMLGWPHLSGVMRSRGLAAPKAGVEAAKLIVQAMKDVAHQFDPKALVLPSKEGFSNTHLSDLDLWALQELLRAGVIKEGMAVELGAYAAGGGLTRMFPQLPADLEYYMRRASEMGTKWFALTEEFNRRVMGLATFRAALAQGLPKEAAIKEAIRAVDVTQGNYDAANKPKLMWGKRSLFFIFKSYAQFVAYFMAREQGRMMAAILTVLMAGIKGLPLVEDAMHLIDGTLTLGKRITGAKEPFTRIEIPMRKAIAEIGLDPDLVMNGISRKSFGIPFVPDLDFSSSMSQGRLIPGVGLLEKLMKGTLDWNQAGNEVAKEFLGITGSFGIEASRSLADPNTPGYQPYLPKGAQNVEKAVQMLRSGEARTRAGKPLGKVNVAEAIGQLTGAAPTSIVQAGEARFLAQETYNYYNSWRTSVLSNYGKAVVAKDREARADTIKSVRDFNSRAPREFHISRDELRNSARNAGRREALSQKNLPTSKRGTGIYREVYKGYPDLTPQR